MVMALEGTVGKGRDAFRPGPASGLICKATLVGPILRESPRSRNPSSVKGEVLHTISAPSGQVQRIVIFKKNGVQAMVEYPLQYTLVHTMDRVLLRGTKAKSRDPTSQTPRTGHSVLPRATQTPEGGWSSGDASHDSIFLLFALSYPGSSLLDEIFQIWHEFFPIGDQVPAIGSLTSANSPSPRGELLTGSTPPWGQTVSGVGIESLGFL
ncbi:hypothetical protein WN48_01304 [Eufriesea mexicana]|uniref:Uncharacterized protein n=1 Tax=Eufriesea mexicana TaxID=516756 RepID=A0A310SDV3_9HYME|nr:hypothetical protein WN48_01304 [Eufriesea mexicana]